MKTAQLMILSALYVTQAHAFDLPGQPTKSYECSACGKLSHDTLQDSWQISNNSLDDTVSNLQKSYGYKETVTSEQLHAGVTVPILAPGAVIRIIPLQNNPVPHLLLKTPNHKFLNLKQASTLYSKDELFGDERFSTKHQVLLQIKPELGSGNFLLKSNNTKKEVSNTYLISVLDKFSTTRVTVETDSVHYQYGDHVKATISLNDDDIEFDVEDVHATIVSPGGQIFPLKLKEMSSNHFTGSTQLLSELNDLGENWYVEVDIQTDMGDTKLMRRGHTAFSYSIPSASLVDLKKVSSKPLTFTTTVDVATASRYALQSVLFYKNNEGEIKPVETSQIAQWLEPGKQIIQFTFDNSNQLAEDSLFLGYLRLTDYGQLKTVYQFNKPIKLSELVE